MRSLEEHIRKFNFHGYKSFQDAVDSCLHSYAARFSSISGNLLNTEDDLIFSERKLYNKLVNDFIKTYELDGNNDQVYIYFDSQGQFTRVTLEPEVITSTSTIESFVFVNENNIWDIHPDILIQAL